jgi:hypothetical protein
MNERCAIFSKKLGYGCLNPAPYRMGQKWYCLEHARDVAPHVVAQNMEITGNITHAALKFLFNKPARDLLFNEGILEKRKYKFYSRRGEVIWIYRTTSQPFIGRKKTPVIKRKSRVRVIEKALSKSLILDKRQRKKQL